MNRRQKKKRAKAYTTSKQRRRNKSLCDRFPFLIPRGRFGRPVWDSDKTIKKFEYTKAVFFPVGWWKAFGILMCEELREDLLKYNYLDKLRLEEIKEKYGELRVYTNGVPLDSRVWDIIEKYSQLSRNICIVCGQPDVPVTNRGWISPFCKDCYIKSYGLGKESHAEAEQSYKRAIIEEASKKMQTEYTVFQYGKDGDDKKVTYDISETAQKIRGNWKR